MDKKSNEWMESAIRLWPRRWPFVESERWPACGGYLGTATLLLLPSKPVILRASKPLPPRVEREGHVGVQVFATTAVEIQV